MGIVTGFYIILIISSIIICILSILIAAIKKKMFKMLLSLLWLFFVITSFVLTWILYQGYDPLVYRGYLSELTYLIDLIADNQMLAKIVLGTNISVFFVGIIYLIALLANIKKGIKTTAKNTKQYLTDKYNSTKNDIKNFFDKDKEDIELINKTDEEEDISAESKKE